METQSSSAKLGRIDALKLAKLADEIVVAKGSKVTRFAMDADRTADVDLLKHMLGPTGNLRAPTIRIGKTLLIGFNKDVYETTLA